MTYFLWESGGTLEESVAIEHDFKLPVGSYKLRPAYYESGVLKGSQNYFDLTVPDAPFAAGTAPYRGKEPDLLGYINVDIAKMADQIGLSGSSGLSYADIELNITADRSAGLSLDQMPESETGIIRVPLGSETEYGGKYKDYPFGMFDLWYRVEKVTESGIFTSSDQTHVDIMQEIAPVSMTLEQDKYYLYYKGETAQITPRFGDDYDPERYRYEGLDRHVVYKSENTKILTVDANGTVKVVGLPNTSETMELDITATSTADPSLSAAATFYVKAHSAGKADMKILDDGKPVSEMNWTIPKQIENNHLAEIVFTIAEPHAELTGMPVTFSISGKSVSLLASPDSTDGKVTQEIPLETDGTAHVWIRGADGGKYTVTAAAPFGRSASVTVNADGYSNPLGGGFPSKQSQYFVNGKMVTGWMKYDSASGEYAFGKNVFKGDIEPSHQFISYMDPVSGLVTAGTFSSEENNVYIRKIDGKLYAFNMEGNLLFFETDGRTADGWRTIHNERAAADHNVFISASGELLTGWAEAAWGELVYFDAELGYPVRDSFVPSGTGRGMTYINKDGRTEGIFVDDGYICDFSEKDGLYRIPQIDEYFMMKDGAIQTGWYYLHYGEQTGFVWNTVKKGCIEKMCFDPEDHGALKRGYFYVNGKQYYSFYSAIPSFGDYYTVQTLISTDPDYPEKYGTIQIDGKTAVIDSDGAIVKKQMVKIGVSLVEGEYERYYVYADENGEVVTDQWVTIGGKRYYFNASGYLETEDMHLTAWKYRDESDSLNSLYCALKNPKKPAEGYSYYIQTDEVTYKKITCQLIYDADGNAVGMVDAKGSLIVNNIATVRPSMAAGSASNAYIADAEGNLLKSDESSMFLMTNVKGKTYIVDEEGIVQKNSTEPVNAWGDGIGSGYVMADKNGVLYKKVFRTVSDDTYGTYKLYFDENGFVEDYAQDLWSEGDTSWAALRVNKKNCLTFEMDDYIGFVIPGKTRGYTAGWQGQADSPVYLNKDGTIRTGFVKHDENTYYIAVSDRGPIVLLKRIVTGYSGGQGTSLYQINGKKYFFDDDGKMITGWVYFSSAIVIDVKNTLFGSVPGSLRLISNGYMYFSEKTGTAVTGANKVPVPAVVEGKISLSSGETFGNDEYRVNTTDQIKTLYFNADGTLIHDQNAVVNKKLTAVGPDGTFSTSEAHWKDAEKNVYILKNGAIATGRTKVDGEYYFFDPSTGGKVVNALRKTGSKWYYYGEFGRQETPLMGSSYLVELHSDLRELFGPSAIAAIDSANGKKLSAIWNKDGSLARIVYAESGKPAAGESVLFALWDYSDRNTSIRYVKMGLNGYVLDSKGLPRTGIAENFSFKEDGGVYTLNSGNDGTRVICVGDDDCFSLMKSGKKYYVMHEGLIENTIEGVVKITDWSALPASDQKSLNELAAAAKASGTGLYVMKNMDGTTAVKTMKFSHTALDSGSIYGESAEGLWIANEMGVVLDLIAPYYKVGKKTYMSRIGTVAEGNWQLTDYLLHKYETDGRVSRVYATLKFNGSQLLGFFDPETGKALSGTYLNEISTSEGHVRMMMWLSNGLPQTGNRTLTDGSQKETFYVHPALIGWFGN